MKNQRLYNRISKTNVLYCVKTQIISQKSKQKKICTDFNGLHLA